MPWTPDAAAATPAALPEPVPLTIGGRRYVPALGITFAQDEWTITHALACGIAAHNINEILQSTTDPVKISEMLVARVVAAGRTTQILAGCYVPEGEAWSHATALATAEAFATSTDAAERGALWAALARVLLSFFVSAVASSRTSPSFSALASDGPASDATAVGDSSGTSLN